MSFKQAYEKFCRAALPNDMTFSEIETIARHFGCEVDAGGKHSKKLVHRPTGTVIPIPMHGKTVGEAYVKELKKLIAEITTEE